jgi:hypothetical protein
MRQGILMQSWASPGSHLRSEAVGEFHQGDDEEEERAFNHGIQGMIHDNNEVLVIWIRCALI